MEGKRCPCGGTMTYCGRQTIHMNGSPLFMEYSTDFRTVDLYLCPTCRKMEFYAPVSREEETLEENAMRLYAKSSAEELRRLLADSDYPEDIHRAARRLLDQKTET